MIKRILSIILIAGGAVLLFLSIGYYIRQREQDGAAEQFCEEVSAVLADSREGYEPDKDNRIRAFLEENKGFSYERYSNASDMYTVYASGEWFIGEIEIPALDISLPVNNNFDEEKIYLSPCRYSGSVYDDTLVIAGSAYDSQFGKLSGLVIGDNVTFTDIFGIYRKYAVSDLQTYAEDQLETALTETEDAVDMTLFTWSGKGRNILAVRLTAY